MGTNTKIIILYTCAISMSQNEFHLFFQLRVWKRVLISVDYTVYMSLKLLYWSLYAMDKRIKWEINKTIGTSEQTDSTNKNKVFNQPFHDVIKRGFMKHFAHHFFATA